jgi:hypothetical protein
MWRAAKGACAQQHTWSPATSQPGATCTPATGRSSKHRAADTEAGAAAAGGGPLNSNAGVAASATAAAAAAAAAASEAAPTEAAGKWK